MEQKQKRGRAKGRKGAWLPGRYRILMRSVRLLKGVGPSSGTLCLSVSCYFKSSVPMDRSIRTQSKQRALGTCPTYCGAEETAEERRFNSTVFWDTLFGKFFAQRVFFFPGVWRNRQTNREALPLNKEFESLFPPSCPPYFV